MSIESVAGDVTEITGTAGVILSPGYDVTEYPSQFSHSWVISVSSRSDIELKVTDLSTESNRDILQVNIVAYHLARSRHGGTALLEN